MRVQDLMSAPVEATTPDESAEAAWQRMKQQRIRHLVVRDIGRLLGVFSAEDAGGARGAALRRGRTVADLMTPRTVTVAPTTTLHKAANVMRGRSIGSLVVIANGHAVGIITVSDLLEVIGRGAGSSRLKQRPLLNHRVPHRKRHTSTAAW